MKAFSAFLLTLAVSGHASAQSPSPDYNWTGMYFGVSGGYGWSELTNTLASPFGPSNINDFTFPEKTKPNAHGALFGAQWGYNWQANRNWVFGIETDFAAGGISGEGSVRAVGNLTGATTNTLFDTNDNINWLASVRARIGFSWGASMAYFTGGVAWENVSARVNLAGNTAPSVYGQSANTTFTYTQAGGVLGGGVEWAIADRWTVRTEYLHYMFGSQDLGDITISNNCGGATAAVGPCGARVTAGSSTVDTLRLGVNYKW